MPNDNVLTEQIRAVCNAHVVTIGDDFALGADRLAKRILVLLAAHPSQPKPIDMILYCPNCGTQHIDRPELHSEADASIGLQIKEVVTWDNPPHRSHLCSACRHVWRPADVPTNGVAAIKTRGKDDKLPNPQCAPPAIAQPAPSPADERAAKLAAFKAIVSDSGMSNYDYFCEGWERARAASVNGTGAEGAKLNKPAKVGATRFGVGVKWSTVIGAAQRLYEYEVTPEKEAARIERARSVLDDIRNGKYASESAQADARVGLTESATVVRIEQLRKALFESRDAMRVMSNWVKKSDPAGHSWAVHMVDRTNAALNGEPEPRAEVTDCGCETNEACKMKTDGSCWRAD